MPEYRLVDNRRNASSVVREMVSSLDGFNEAFLKLLADEIVDLSPVDTGTYMDNHNMHVGKKGRERTESSHGKPRNQSYSSHAESARSRLYGEIGQVKSGEEVFVSNTAVHSVAVEYGGHNWKRGPYAVYRTARAKIGIFAQMAAAAVRGRS